MGPDRQTNRRATAARLSKRGPRVINSRAAANHLCLAGASCLPRTPSTTHTITDRCTPTVHGSRSSTSERACHVPVTHADGGCEAVGCLVVRHGLKTMFSRPEGTTQKHIKHVTCTLQGSEPLEQFQLSVPDIYPCRNVLTQKSRGGSFAKSSPCCHPLRTALRTRSVFSAR